MIRRLVPILSVVVVLACACGDDTESADTVSTISTTTQITATTEPTDTVSSSSAPSPSTATTTESVAPLGRCDPAPAVTIATEAITAARLTNPDARWTEPTQDGAFVNRTTDHERFAQTLGFDCSWSATQNVDDGQRLAVAAWTDDRLSMVIQATDRPTVPFRSDQTYDLLIDAPEGELVAEDTWAGTMSSGETVIVLTRNTSNSGATAKSWLADYVLVPDEDVVGETPTERMALPVLRAAGGRNVYIGEPSHGSPLATLVLTSPTGDTVEVFVGPDDQFDPFDVFTNYSSAEPFDDDIDGTPVRFSNLDPAVEFVASTAAFNCNGFGWIITASTGDTTETRNFIIELIAALDCT